MQHLSSSENLVKNSETEETFDEPMRKASAKLFFTKPASVWSVWSQMLPESLSTARRMIQGQKFTVKDKPKGEAYK